MKMRQRPLKILQLVSSLTVGGAEQIVLTLAERIARPQFEVHVCSLSVVGENRLEPAFRDLPVTLLSLNATRFYDWRTAQQVRRHVRREEIDVIHTHLTDADIIGRFIARTLSLPVLSTLHNVPHNYESQRRDRYWLQRFTARYWATHLVAVAPYIRDLYVQKWNIPPTRISAIQNSIRMERFLSVAPGVPDSRDAEGPIITNVARLNPQKAQHNLLAALPAVLERFPGARLLLVGKGHLEDALRRQADEMGLGKHVVFTGIRHDIPEILARTTVFVLSSKWEGLPLSAIEALAAARPVVVTDVGGVAELVEDRRTGLVVPPDDPAALAQGLLTLLTDPAFAEELGLCGRRRVQRRFSTERFVRQYEALYERLASRKPVGINRPVGKEISP